MTAKHRKGKGSPKNEDNFLKPEVVESDARPGGSTHRHTLSLGLILVVVLGGLVGLWICFQQQQTLTELTDSLEALQLKVVQLQSSHAELRQSSDKLHASQSLETRLTALEDSCALAQKQVNMALATSEPSKVSDLSTQVLSLHAEMTARLAELEKTTVTSDELTEKSEEMEQVRVQVEGLTALSTELSRHVEALTVSQAEAEAKLEGGVGQVAALSATVEGQSAEALRVKEQLDSFQAQLEANALEVAGVRAALEEAHSQQRRQADSEEQIVAVRESLLQQKSEVQKFHVDVWAELEHIQRQILQLMAKPRAVPEPVKEPEEAEEEAVETVAEEAEVSAAAGNDKEEDDRVEAEEEEPEGEMEEESEVEPEKEEVPQEEVGEVEVGRAEVEETGGADSEEERADNEREDEEETLEVSVPEEENGTVQDAAAREDEDQGDEDSEPLEWNDDDDEEEH
ncbi:uncharacterized protein ACB058_019146 [Synchiropus picturatus]